MNEQEYKSVKEKFPTVAGIWKSAVEEFPDEKLREHFTNFDNFFSFYNKMNNRFSDEEVRFEMIFDICPELKSIADDTSEKVTVAINAWADKAGWY